MKKILVLVTMLFSQVFFTGSVYCGNTKPIESGRDSLSPAGNESDWVMTMVDEKV